MRYLRDTAALARFTYLRLLDVRDGYYARSRLLDHLNGNRFDYWSDRPFHLPHSFGDGRAFGLGLGRVFK